MCWVEFQNDDIVDHFRPVSPFEPSLSWQFHDRTLFFLPNYSQWWKCTLNFLTFWFSTLLSSVFISSQLWRFSWSISNRECIQFGPLAIFSRPLILFWPFKPRLSIFEQIINLFVFPFLSLFWMTGKYKN